MTHNLSTIITHIHQFNPLFRKISFIIFKFYYKNIDSRSRIPFTSNQLNTLNERSTLKRPLSPLTISLTRNSDNNGWNLSESPVKKKNIDGLNPSNFVRTKVIKKKPFRNNSQRTIIVPYIMYISYLFSFL